MTAVVSLYRGVFVGRNLCWRDACRRALLNHHTGRRAMGLSCPWDYFVLAYNRNTGWAVLRHHDECPF